MADTGRSFGAFTEGLLRGSEFAQDSRRRSQINQALQRENKRQGAIDDTRSQVAQAETQGVDRALQGPPVPGQEGELRTDPAAYLQSLYTQATLSGDENSQKAVKNMAFRTATAKIQEARQAPTAEEQLAKLNQAAAIGGFGKNSVYRDANGQLVLPIIGAVPAGKEALAFDYMAKFLSDPTNAGHMFRDEDLKTEDTKSAISARQEATNQGWTRLNQVWKQLGNDTSLLNQRRDEFAQKMDLAIEKFGLDKKYTNAQIDRLNSLAAAAEAEAALLGNPPAWGKASDLNTAMDQTTDEYANLVMTPVFDTLASLDEKYTREDLAIRGETLAKEAIAEHGPTARSTALEGSIATMKYMLGDPTLADKNVFVGRDPDTGRAMLNIGGTTNSNGGIDGGTEWAISDNAHDMIMVEQERRGAGKEARATSAINSADRALEEQGRAALGLDENKQWAELGRHRRRKAKETMMRTEPAIPNLRGRNAVNR